jgi:hypothetical protein
LPGNAQQANDILDQMEEAHEQGTVSFRPNLFTYNLVIDAWSRAAEKYEPEAAWNAVRVLRRLITSKDTPDPDTYSFNQAFAALAKSQKEGAATMAVQLLQYMENAHRLKMHKSVRPDVIGYTSVILALTRSKEADSAERAEAILRRMKERHYQGEPHMKPNRACFHAVIDCWAKSDKGTLAARKAEALLQEMEELCANGLPKVAPNTYTYNAVLKSWEKSGTRCCGNQAQKHLERMWQLHQDGDNTIAPDDLSFKIVSIIMECWQNCFVDQPSLTRVTLLYPPYYKNRSSMPFPRVEANRRPRKLCGFFAEWTNGTNPDTKMPVPTKRPTRQS